MCVYIYIYIYRPPQWLSSKETACNAEGAVSIPGLGRSPGEGHGYPVQYSCLGNLMDRGTWWATVDRFAELDTTEAAERERENLIFRQISCDFNHIHTHTYKYTSLKMGIHTMCMCAKSLQSCLTLCDPMDRSPPGSSVHGISQAGILEWLAISSSRGSSWARDRTSSLASPALAVEFFTTSTTWETHPQSTISQLFISAVHSCRVCTVPHVSPAHDYNHLRGSGDCLVVYPKSLITGIFGSQDSSPSLTTGLGPPPHELQDPNFPPCSKPQCVPEGVQFWS